MKKIPEEAFTKSLRTSFRENLEQAKLKLACMKENFEYREWFEGFLEWYARTPAGDKVWPGGEFQRFGLVGLRFLIGHPQWREILDIINPHKNVSTCSSAVVASILPQLFYAHAVEIIEVGKISHFEGGTTRPIRAINDKGLKPGERLYKVDLTKKKTQIMREFEGYLDRAYLSNAEAWTPDTTRDRAEAWGYLDIWNLRKKRKTFPEIARALHITTEAAKKGFDRACELTQHKKYDRETLKKLLQAVRKTEVGTPCDDCPKKEKNCTTLCPDMLQLVTQDYTPLREKLS